MAQTRPLPERDEHSDEDTLGVGLSVSAATMERRRAFARAAREIAGRTPQPWTLDTVALLRADRDR